MFIVLLHPNTNEIPHFDCYFVPHHSRMRFEPRSKPTFNIVLRLTQSKHYFDKEVRSFLCSVRQFRFRLYFLNDLVNDDETEGSINGIRIFMLKLSHSSSD
jgi:hypothetical protein